MTPDRELQEALAQTVIKDGISVRALEELMRNTIAEQDAAAAPSPPVANGQPATAPSAPTLRPPGVLELEELLANHLNTRVKVEMHAKRGRVVVEFATLEDLERIYRLMIGESSS